jgi:uncharacterized protein
LEAHFRQKINGSSLLFLDEIQAAPKVFSRLRYFWEDTPHIAVIAAGSLLEFVLDEFEYSVPVGRVEYMHLGPLRFEEYLNALGEKSLIEMIQGWNPSDQKSNIADIFHDRLLGHVRDFSLVGGMPEVMNQFVLNKDFLKCESIQRSLLETYQQDFSKVRKRIPLERLQKIFEIIPSQVGQKWVYARVNPGEKAQATEKALDVLCKARVAHRICHSSGQGVPLGAGRKDNFYKAIFLDVGLMGIQLYLVEQLPRILEKIASGII